MSEEIEELPVEQQIVFARGFNAGYILQRENVPLLTSLQKGIQDTASLIYISIDHGARECRKEMFEEKHSGAREKRNNKEKGKDKDYSL
jgi:hypothetical protein